ncbi:FmdB family zinc ribbon protein [Leifsonia sp. A12D58]|uniref:FmdB family zinc ribbon protein n=1 Tax=Leifsonia sp. A12D58 TaxID=3397674 RepID=UPI0039E0B0CE
MPLYDFRCPEGTTFETAFPLSAVPDSTMCPECHQPARRQMSSPRLSIATSAEFKLIDSTKRSAHEPEVVSGRTGATKQGTRYTSNPLHRKLPRP